ncbi:hypothetical protein HK102_000826, partial [Quaeritorhiza haematococci]
MEVTKQHIDNCRFSSWYERFRSVSLKSRIIKPLPEAFIDYLNSDGVFLPLDQNGQPQPSYEPSRKADDYDLDEGSVSWSDDEGEEEEENNIPHFPELQQQIEDIIEELGGAVFPKMNWSSPKDATWISMTGTLKCDNIAEIFLLLKSSDFIAHDLSHAYDHCTSSSQPNNTDEQPTPQQEQQEQDQTTQTSTTEASTLSQPDSSALGPSFELVLRKWYDLSPSMEFRCFVRDRVLIAISQRDYVNFYPFLNEVKEELQEKITDFFEENIRDKFPDPSFVFDVYINRNNRKVWLVDFNPFGPMTDTLLYTWDEILSAQTPTLRIITSPVDLSTISATKQPLYSSNRLPKDMFDISAGGVSVDEMVERLRTEIQQSLDIEDR